jgi:hypothetical protein
MPANGQLATAGDKLLMDNVLRAPAN